MQHNAYHWFIFRDGALLLKHEADGTWQVPCSENPPIDVPMGGYIAQLPEAEGHEGRAFEAAPDAPTEKGWEWVKLRASYDVLTEPIYLLAGKGSELVYWDKQTRYCSRCGSPLQLHSNISKKCPDCGREVWPQLNIAIIVLVRRGQKALLVRAKNFAGNFRGLIAGFVETGETLEECVAREVMEETGITIKNLQYFGSQPWPYPLGLMCGFTAEYEDGEICLQRSELIDGDWYDRNHLPVIPPKLSMARRLLDAWQEGRFDK